MRFAFDPTRPDSFPRRLCAVFPHPDDEAWGAGGLLARAVEHGTEVTLVTLSAGEAGRDHRSGLRGAALAAARTVELNAAAAVLGITRVHICDLPDGNIALESAIEKIAGILGGTWPEVFVTFDRDGGYPHRDHTTTVRAVEAVARTAQSEPLVLGAAFPRDLLRPLYEAFVARRPELLDVSWAPDPTSARLPPAGATTPEALRLGRERFDLELDLSATEAHAKRAALSAHQTQLRRPGAAGADAFLGPGVFPALCRRERYVVLGSGPT